MKKHHKITSLERDQIAYLLAVGNGLRSVARKLGRSVGSISSEIRRNSVAGKYSAITAQEKSQRRNRENC